MTLIPFVPLIGKVLDKIFPDPTVAAEVKVKILELEQKGDLEFLQAETQLALSQAGINLEDAKSEDKFKSRWRPAIGWLCGIGLTYQTILQPLLAWASLNFGWVAPPVVDTGTLVPLLMGMLGLGGLRTFEKYTGKA